MKEWTDEELKAYYKHMSEAGYDPLLCVKKTERYIDFSGKQTFIYKESLKFIDRIITEDRFVDLIKHGEVSKLDDVIPIRADTVVVLAPYEIAASVKLFWLYPSGCRTLNDLFERYKAKIKILM